jgi:hypothetical protein
MLKRTTIALALTLAVTGPLGVIGCGEGPSEKAGERMDGNTSGVKDKLTPDGAAEKAGKDLDRAVDDATD